MPDTASNFNIYAWSRTVTHLAQQMQSVLAQGAMFKMADGGPGSAVHFDRLGPMVAAKRMTRIATTALIDPDHSRRRAVLEVYDLPVVVSDTDDLMMLMDPTNEYTRGIAAAMERTKDDVILTALNAAAITVATEWGGQAAQTLTTVALPVGQIIASGADIIGDLRKIMRTLDEAGAEPEERYFAGSPLFFDRLLGSTQTTSADYNTVRTLVQGQIDTFMGFKFVKTPRITGATTHANFAWQKNGVGLAMARETKFTQTVRGDLNDAQQIRGNLVMGAVRIDDKRVIRYDMAVTP
jgi:Phage capsid protein